MIDKRQKNTSWAKGTKKAVIFAIMMIVAVVLYGENREISNLYNGNLGKKVGGYISLDTKFSQLDDKLGIFLGGRLAFILDHNLSLGVAGFGLLPEPKVNIFCPVQGHDSAKNSYLEVFYGGLFVEYIHLPTDLIHFSVNNLIGVGGIGISHNEGNLKSYLQHSMKAFLFIEPSIDLNLNISKIFKTTLGVGYRITSDTTLKYDDKKFASSSVIEGFSINFGLKLGSF